MEKLTIRRPDDWHVHLREGVVLPDTCRDMCRYIGRAVVMPNLSEPITNLVLAETYFQNIQTAMAEFPRRFSPLMTLYLTDKTSKKDIEQAADSPLIVGIKLYPAGATTNSHRGIDNINALFPIIETMELKKIPLMVHGEVTDPETDPFDKEKIFVERYLEPLTIQFPELKITLEHITTKEAVDFILEAKKNVAATITPHHLMYSRNDLFIDGIRPHLYCLPILKRSHHQNALIQAATSGNPKFS